MGFRVGVIGAAGAGRSHLRAASAIDGIELVACADVSEEALKQANEEYGIPGYRDYQEMLAAEDLDAVTIAVPSGLHAPIGIACLESGRHVLCEKPLATTVEDADAMIDAARKAGVKLAGVFQRRLEEGTRAARQLVSEGILGQPVICDLDNKWYRTQKYYDGTWKGSWEMDGGAALINQAIHGVDILQWTAQPAAGLIKEVYARGAHLTKEIEAEDVIVALIEWENGAFGVIQASTSTNGVANNTHISLSGENGTVELSGGKVVHIARADGPNQKADKLDAEERQQVVQAAVARDPYDVLYEGGGRGPQLADLAQAVADDRAPFVSDLEARHAVAVVNAIYDSWRGGKPVKVSRRED